FLAILTWGLITPCMGYSLILITLAQAQHTSNFMLGLLFASGGLGSIVGALLSNPLQRRFSFAQMMIGSSWLWAISWLGLAIAPNTLVLGIANGISFIIVPIYMSVQFSYRLAITPDHLQGRVNSVFRLLSYGGVSLGTAGGGLLLGLIGPRVECGLMATGLGLAR
ncbi:MAG: MFS transporter, partial [Chloroflexota bacterium]|nr:MFS transporter [Chloroflexota bacterium]